MKKWKSKKKSECEKVKKKVKLINLKSETKTFSKRELN